MRSIGAVFAARRSLSRSRAAIDRAAGAFSSEPRALRAERSATVRGLRS